MLFASFSGSKVLLGPLPRSFAYCPTHTRAAQPRSLLLPKPRAEGTPPRSPTQADV